MKKSVVTYTITCDNEFTRSWEKQVRSLIPAYKKLGIVIKIRKELK